MIGRSLARVSDKTPRSVTAVAVMAVAAVLGMCSVVSSASAAEIPIPKPVRESRASEPPTDSTLPPKLGGFRRSATKKSTT